MKHIPPPRYPLEFDPTPKPWDNSWIEEYTWLLLIAFAWIVGLGLGIWLVKGGWL